MSKPASNEAPLQSTKQMLDELDALMDQMLALPGNDLESAPPVAAPDSPALTATLAALEQSLPQSKPAPPAPVPLAMPIKSMTATLEPMATALPVESLATPLPLHPHPATNPPHLRPETMPPAPEVLTNTILPPSLLAKLEPLLADIPKTYPSPSRRWVYEPLVGVNNLFDSATTMLGPLGERLRGAAGRTLVGFAGIALLAASAVWLLKDWLGWQW